MCGRYTLTSAPEALRALFGYAGQPNFPPRYNIAPTQPIAIVRMAEGKRQFALVRWGLLPSWVKDPKAFTLLINARGESVIEKPAFRAAIKRRRCLIPADGFYEWQKAGERKRPYFVRAKKRRRRLPSPACGRPGPGRTARNWRRRRSSRRGRTRALALSTSACRLSCRRKPSTCGSMQRTSMRRPRRP